MRRVLAGILWLAGCGQELEFTIGREFEACEANLPTACGATARCVLDGEHYLGGQFPGTRRFLVRTEGETTIKFQLLLGDQRAPGTELRLVVHEPGCGDRYEFDSAGQDIFRLAGNDSVLGIPIHVTRAGDHLVELVSDAYASYLLKQGG
ncbi:MAG: hypothetical protein HY698_06795 [Deltaproteobacteria bacterium]|nr:hypothetical protein [Deltaproteobacteria bacterium]